jgi:hypothetical protein
MFAQSLLWWGKRDLRPMMMKVANVPAAAIFAVFFFFGRG